MTPDRNPIRPSETTDFIRCNRFWQYKHVEGWSAPPSAWTPERLMGTAVHVGLSAYWDAKIGRPTVPPEDEVSGEFALSWPPDAPPEFSREGLEAQCVKVLDKVLAWVKVNMPDAEPLMVEQALGADGHTTPDLVTREEGQLVVTDWKTSWNLDADKVRYRLEGLDRTFQFLHYAWAVGEYLKEPVRLIRKVVIVGSPRIIVREATWAPTPAAIKQWLTSARQMWEDMSQVKAGERVASMNTNGCKMYGDKYPCPYWEACFTCHGDRRKMTQFLVKDVAQ